MALRRKRQQRGFSRAIAPNQTDSLASLNGKVRRIQQRLAAEVQGYALHAQKCQNLLQRLSIVPRM